jgi:phenylpropionate dioxygenase-like ring-hydroxylating dioxygenase large terminal subunit
MNQAYLEQFRKRSAIETERTAPPEGFPILPDIPLGRYTDPEFFQLERTKLFGRTWLYAAHDSEFTEVGAYRVCDIAGASVLLVRGDDGEMRAFFNACRHRGAPVVRGECGTARMLVCQYHSWTYDLAGQLARVPDELDFVGLCKEERGLAPVRCERWGDWWFVNLDSLAEPLHEALGPLLVILADVASSSMRVINRKSVELNCNWNFGDIAVDRRAEERSVSHSSRHGYLDLLLFVMRH